MKRKTIDANALFTFFDSLVDGTNGERVKRTAARFDCDRATVYDYLSKRRLGVLPGGIVTKRLEKFTKVDDLSLPGDPADIYRRYGGFLASARGLRYLLEPEREPPVLRFSIDSAPPEDKTPEPPPVEEPPNEPENGEAHTFTPNGNEAEFIYTARKPITTLDELLAAAQVDLTVWRVKSFIVNTWPMGYIASKVAGIATPASHPLFQVKAVLERIKPIPVNFGPIQPVQVEIFHRVQPQVIETKLRRCAVIPDIQVGYRRNLMTGELTPFHDRACMDLGLQLLADMRPDVIVLLGDNLDLPDWSMKFLTTPECKQLTQTALIELAWLHGKLRAICPSAEIHYLEGNHELRMQNAVAANLAQAYGLRSVDQLHDDPALSVPKLLNLAALDIQYHGSYPQGRYRLNSNFLFHHGRLVRAKSGKTVAAMADDLRRNEGVGHIHRVECASKTLWTAEEEPKVYQAWSFGTWASILPGRVPGNSAEPNWQNAMGDIWYEVNSDGDDGMHDLATVTAPLFYRDTVIHNGKRYQARPEAEMVADIAAETGWDVTTGYRRRATG